MTILQALDRYYDRMAARGEADPPGWSREKISFCIVLSEAGDVVQVLDLRDHTGKKPQPRLLSVPESVIRTAGIKPNTFWDKTSYVLGVTASEGKRTADEAAAFKDHTLTLIAGSRDVGLMAFAHFLQSWTPERFAPPFFTDEMRDANFVFRLDGDPGFLHEREAARRIVEDLSAETDAEAIQCLVSGNVSAPARLHPSIRGVSGAQSSGASLVSFNLDAFESYGKEQGLNAPTSKTAAFRYGSALNRMLDRGSPNRLQRSIGDATIVFWAHAAEAEAKAAEDAFSWLIEPPTDVAQAAKVRDALADVAAGRVGATAPDLKPGVRFHVLGLSPNAARLSVRFWAEDDFSAFAQRLLDHERDLAIEPKPWGSKPPSVFLLLCKTTALQEKAENVPPLLAGEVMRAVLTGARYPRTLLSAALTRLRAGDDASRGWHAAAIRAVLARDFRLNLSREETPMALDRENANPAYRLGRLFAAYETAQRLALGKVNSTIRDKYFGAASATPASVFPLIVRGAQNHLAKLRKEKPGLAFTLDKEIEDIFSQMKGEWPRSLTLEAQGRFAIGYYHQRRGQFEGKKDLEAELAATEGTEND